VWCRDRDDTGTLESRYRDEIETLEWRDRDETETLDWQYRDETETFKKRLETVSRPRRSRPRLQPWYISLVIFITVQYICSMLLGIGSWTWAKFRHQITGKYGTGVCTKHPRSIRGEWWVLLSEKGIICVSVLHLCSLFCLSYFCSSFVFVCQCCNWFLFCVGCIWGEIKYMNVTWSKYIYLSRWIVGIWNVKQIDMKGPRVVMVLEFHWFRVASIAVHTLLSSCQICLLFCVTHTLTILTGTFLVNRVSRFPCWYLIFIDPYPISLTLSL